ncbi:NADPH-dependent FMN reductase [Gilvimarinus xylanilyticus]|uniref:NAD(P)H-dependent oxidoreductase n=1 Tax=Gilvimarinus xylanilyticus TaxID=2944139 RepID=A0A9X2HSX8_9GAMM|nr:NADPH-dependent FMN reductase [Gilvimarinus xylanilyticus]MCP8897963.1 NAD(P)H-dependent oxidoreductase [Gilvimarinus xylanilyticus]
MKLLLISGSLREESLNTALLNAVVQSLGDKATCQWARIGDVPLYNQDNDGDSKPAAVDRLKAQIKDADALVIATPEYNYGIPGVLKNALDWVSRPAYKSVLAHKKTLLLSASMSPMGGVRAQGQLKQVLAGTLTPFFPAPEFAVGGAQNKFKDGDLTDDDTREKLQRLLNDFLAWV